MKTCSLHGRNTNEEKTIASWTAEVANLACSRLVGRSTENRTYLLICILRGIEHDLLLLLQGKKKAKELQGF